MNTKGGTFCYFLGIGGPCCGHWRKGSIGSSAITEEGGTFVTTMGRGELPWLLGERHSCEP